MLPQGLVLIREIGNTEAPYWTAASRDGVHLELEPGESVLYVCSCTVAQLTPKGAQLQPKPLQLLPKAWTLEYPTTVVITDRRTAFLTTQFDKGGGWAGFGVIGASVALTANAVSHSRAAKRSAGKVAIGQVRHEWLTSIGLRFRKPLLGLDTYIHLAVATTAGTAVIELQKGKVIDEPLARWLVSTVATHRMALLPPGSPDAGMLRSYQAAGGGAINGANPGDLRWPLPGATAELIASVLAPREGAPSATE